MKTNISQPFFQISEANIISRGISNGHEYIVYCSDKSVNVNTDFKKINKDMYNCCSYYDRKLCDTISKFEEMSKEKIESQAYGSVRCVLVKSVHRPSKNHKLAILFFLYSFLQILR